jgi:MFS transporter, DHA1 family, solute carrier family 18 (vesicular amine transporter), member 1/2
MSSQRSRAVAVSLVTVATFTDIVAYSIAVPVLPDFSRRLGASPTTIGLLFASFGVTLLGVSIPMGAVSDRVGRRLPLVGGLAVLAASTCVLGLADRLPWLFAARLMQGAADAVTWVVGFALIADLYGPAERGRVMGLVMAGTGFGFMIGPPLGGWLYEIGGSRLPFLVVAGLAAFTAVAFLFAQIPTMHAQRDVVPVGAVLREPAIASCAAAVVAASATISMLEPVLPLFLSSHLGLGPARVGLLFGAGAAASTALHPVCGRLTDRWGGRRLTMIGLALTACILPLLSRAWNFESALVFYLLQAAMVAVVITPSLAYMAEATSAAGVGSFGVAYGLYNVAWGAGLLAGPALGGFLFERIGFPALALMWAPVVVAVAVGLARAGQAESRPGPV